MKHYTPRDYQKLGTDFILAHPHCALFAQPGLGKTVIAETVIDMLRLLSEVDRVLVVVPKRVLDTEGWQRELRKWHHLQNLAIEPITGNARERREKLASPAPIHLINYELLPWLLDELVRCWPYDMVILDESTKVKGHDSTWFMGNPRSKEDVAIGTTLSMPDGRALMLDIDSTVKKLPGNTRKLSNQVPSRIDTFSSHPYTEYRRIAPPAPKRIEFLPTPGLKHVRSQTKRWLNLTGTPMPNGAKDLWSQTHLLDQGARLGENITAFRSQYMQPHPYVKHQWVEQVGALDRVIGKIGDICLSIKAADYLDLPELVANVIEVRIDDDLMPDYKHLEDEFYLALQGHVVEAANSAVLGNKLRQFTQGFLFTGKNTWQEIHRAKLDALRDLSDQVNAPMLIAYWYEPDRERLLKAFKGSAVAFDGSRKQIDAFAAGSIQHLVIHPGSAGHGIDGLQDGSDTLAFYGMDWSLELHDQVIERIGPTRQMQSGHPRPVFCHYIAAQKTIDERVLERLIAKKSVQEILLDAMRQRGLAPGIPLIK